MMKRSMLALLTTIIMVFLFSGAALAQDGQGTVLISGNMSDTISWQLDSEGTLSFSGSGVIQSTSAWGKMTSDAEFTSKYVPMVKKLVVEEGITKIEELFYLTFPNLKESWLPDHFTSIGSRVFANNTSLESVHFGSDTCDFSYIGTSAFYKCPSLKEVYYPLTVGSWNLIDIDCFNGDLRKAASSAGIPISGEGAWGDITWKVEETTDGVQLTLSGNGAVPKMSTSFCTTGEAVTAWHQFRYVLIRA